MIRLLGSRMVLISILNGDRQLDNSTKGTDSNVLQKSNKRSKSLFCRRHVILSKSTKSQRDLLKSRQFILKISRVPSQTRRRLLIRQNLWLKIKTPIEESFSINRMSNGHLWVMASVLGCRISLISRI